ncbi:MAG: 3-hydroxyisobutyrate dehydrogenase [Pseudomonadales bacterium]|jgi:3-hydroxyisobutyrate dehydrogenase|nr:3-hydroxyisobutyrate dehydrogenase [Gammaproteobacteria bacterium]MDP6025997.1 3-hydroxyisobutyrate dehydrogenase [Pseudomonadales bacterium]MDP6316860.1 3-hydroxyisobutyrate dehydrogenase [Pseudomonadales bacterium]MDP7315969.1 3-hydroxyisobutyrate dehydrogenase [Pseudomonadales bacterium]MDP7577635.1 3-hydroxyisobutyrate dehydrogenase [Pseudomonadales bacterium]|tara:strand:+ start:1169 stop:2068 length:900 start_codon:yes stop_codon:yes gene_type:complete
MTTIGFIGLGNMGGPMTTNLLKAGYEIKAFDIVPELLEKSVAEGATACNSAAEAAVDVDVLISMLPASLHVEGLYLGDDGILGNIDPKTLVVDCSTIAPGSARKVSEAADEKGISMLDAPVSGGVGGAVAGTLTFIVGGAALALERARPLLEIMGKNIFHAGNTGAGQVAKICNNMLLSVLMTGTAESLQLGVDNGLDPAVLSEIMKKSSGGNWALETYNPYPGVMSGVPSANEYEGGFLVDLMIKDLGLAMESALDTGASTPMGSLARNLYISHGKDGYGRKDFSSIQRVFTRVTAKK